MPAVQEAVVLEAASAEEGLVGVERLGSRQGIHVGAGGGGGKVMITLETDLQSTDLPPPKEDNLSTKDKGCVHYYEVSL